MSIHPSLYVLDVRGDLACFSRPEMKIERFSYPIATPSAARGVFDAVYWKKTFRWQVVKIETLTQPRYIALRRNEVKDKVSTSAVASWMKGADIAPMFADGDRDLLGNDQKGRTQRQTMALKDVAYRLHARMIPWPGHEDDIVGMEAQFKRRAKAGQCFYQPFLGCREFPAFFRLVENGEELASPFPMDMDLGLMLYDVFDLAEPGSWNSKPAVSLFRGRVHCGVMEVPDYFSDDVLKPEGGRENA